MTRSPLFAAVIFALLCTTTSTAAIVTAINQDTQTQHNIIQTYTNHAKQGFQGSQMVNLAGATGESVKGADSE